jgi:hypothetical protein
LRFLEGARQRITGNQLDPAGVVRVIADLVEADETRLVNLVPPDMLARMDSRRLTDPAPTMTGHRATLVSRGGGRSR